jgi:hypothetical protein
MSKKKKIKSLHKKGGGKLSFIIHATDEFPVLPTHTHGMTKIGMPEFLMDPLSFGPYGTGSRINVACKYFNKPENRSTLEAIKNGETVKLTHLDLVPDKNVNDPYVYCLRRVFPDFEMVKQAYLIESHEDIDPNMWFIQIYVEGDNYVLTDQYYRGGIKW